jgi:hypothetical protein
MTWIEENRRIWAERFDKLDAHLHDIQQAALPRERAGAGPAPGDRILGDREDRP